MIDPALVHAGVAAMAVAAALLVTWGARRRGRGDTDRRGANLGVFAHRRRELAAEGKAQGLGEADLANLDAELLASLHDETQEEAAESPAVAKPPGLPALVVGAAFAAAASVGLYALWGEPDAPLLARAADVLGDPEPPEGSLETLADALAGRDDPGSLFHLGHLKIRMRDFEGAARVFDGLRALTPDIEAEAAWAQARYLADGARLGSATRAAVDRVLALEPDHVLALELLAMDAMRRNAYAEASRHLGRLLQRTPPGPRRALFGEALVLAHERMVAGGTAAVPPSPEAAGPEAEGLASPSARVTVAVSVSPGVGVAPDAPVFVIARAPSAGGPPHAVRRLAVRDLPARVELSDADAMLPGRKLSDLEAFELIARIGLGGSPTRAPGDFESAAVTLPRGTAAAALEIALPVAAAD